MNWQGLLSSLFFIHSAFAPYALISIATDLPLVHCPSVYKFWFCAQCQVRDFQVCFVGHYVEVFLVYFFIGFNVCLCLCVLLPTSMLCDYLDILFNLIVLCEIHHFLIQYHRTASSKHRHEPSSPSNLCDFPKFSCVLNKNQIVKSNQTWA